MSSAPMARGPYDKVAIRTEKISDHPANPTSSIYVSEQVARIQASASGGRLPPQSV
ncbi:hypothetical protein [Hyalangium rubrum]|uniref:Uncharacterized protein n=1 Tax=Hyalangium rubrum TaxID=3103134 RepID=A0ABU5HHT6_9BACT|nr:hypothetical protein [Hyalangium sp. s54d21]MDY7232393.1 hypothetical protein [Hyalangium sp. s54d21]